ncbi:MAG: hypothetical protein ACFFBD_27905, partial [Candidatus Hodarchaeota archaeon]
FPSFYIITFTSALIFSKNTFLTLFIRIPAFLICGLWNIRVLLLLFPFYQKFVSRRNETVMH